MNKLNNVVKLWDRRSHRLDDRFYRMMQELRSRLGLTWVEAADLVLSGDERPLPPLAPPQKLN
jgi:hypothetical protein